MNLLKIEDIHVYIGSFHILYGVSMEIPYGKTTVLLGRNGSGKTTCMRAILGLNNISQGKIVLNGEDLTKYHTYEIVQKGIGYVPDTRRIIRTLTVRENLIIAMREGSKSEEERLEYIFDLFPDLKRLKDHKAGALSGGQQQMLAIGRALANDNQLLLIDEPTEGLSPIIARSVLKTLIDIKETGITILLVEQNFKAACAVGDYYYIFDDGKTAHNGLISDLVNDQELISRYLGVKI
ncbi:MAG: ABC transporter ATP-binding protein [Candidatus Hodarchaeales archaeon]